MTTTASHRFRTLTAAAAVAGVLTVSLSGCTGGSDDDGDAVDLTSAPDATWTTSAGVKYPRGTGGQCPEKTNPAPSGYDHTPQCAVIAAMAGQTLLATSNDNDWPKVADEIVAPGPGKAQWAQARALMSVSGKETHPATFAGFKFTDYTDDNAQVLLAVTWPDGTLTAQPTQLVWQAGDWRLVLPTQDTAVDATVIDNLDGFTPFGPTSTK